MFKSEQEKLDKFAEILKALTNEEIKALLIKAGIYDEDMKLTESYRRPD